MHKRSSRFHRKSRRPWQRRRRRSKTSELMLNLYTAGWFGRHLARIWLNGSRFRLGR